MISFSIQSIHYYYVGAWEEYYVDRFLVMEEGTSFSGEGFSLRSIYVRFKRKAPGYLVTSQLMNNINKQFIYKF